MRVRRRPVETDTIQWDGNLATANAIVRELGIDFRVGRTTVRGEGGFVGFIARGIREDQRPTPVPIGCWVLRAEGRTRVLSPEQLAVEWEPLPPD